MIVGTYNLDYMLANIDMVEEKIAISTAAVAVLLRRFDEVGREWRQLM